MGKPVRSEFVSALDRGAAILRALSQDVADQGGDDTDLLRILTDGACRKDIAARLVAHRQPQVTLTQFPCQRLAGELIPQNNGNPWEVLEDVEPTLIEGCTLDFLPFLEGNETSIGGELMYRRAWAKRANLGLSDVKFVLANQHLIPYEMRGNYLLFAGTKFLNPDGRFYVPCLIWNNDCWLLKFFWLSNVFGGHDRLVARK